MYKIGDYVIYKKEACKIKDIKEKYINNLDYYILNPIDDESLTLNVLFQDKNNLRDLISKQELEKIISNIPNIPTIDCPDRFLETEYKTLLQSGDHTNYIKIIKTSYLRNKNRLVNKKKISDKDNKYFQLAERYLYNEFSIVLNKTYEETKEYDKEKVKKLGA